MTLTVNDWLLIFSVPILALIASELYKRKFPNSNSRRGFTLANQQLGNISVASTYIGANITFTSIFILLAQEGYKRGNVAFSVPLCWILGTLFFLKLYPKIREYIVNGVTLHQAIGSVFQSSSVKFYASIWTIIAFVLTIALEFYGGIKLISAANVPLLSYVSIGIIFIIIVGFFTARGGLGGISWADIVLDAITFIGVGVLTSGFISFMGSMIVNGLPAIQTTNNAIIPFPGLDENIIFCISMIILLVPFQFCTFDSWQRLSARKQREKSPNNLIFWSGLIVSAVFCIPIFIGIYLRSQNVFVDVEHNSLVLFEFLKFMQFGPIFIGLIFAGFIAAIFSTADELLNCCSYSFLADALEVDNESHSSSALNNSYKFYVVIFCIIAAALALIGVWNEQKITDIALAVFSTQIVFMLPLYFVFFKKEVAHKYAVRVKYSMIIAVLSSVVFVALGWILKDKVLIEGAPLGAIIVELLFFAIFSLFSKK